MFWTAIKNRAAASFKRLTGVKKKTFRLMVKAVKDSDKKKVKKKGNRRSRPFSLCVEDQVLLTLMYYREYRTQFHIAATYGISESAVCRTIKRIERVLMKIKELQLPGKQQLSGSRQEVSVVVIDATEMPIERPKKSNSSTIRAKRSGIP
jgi:predicted DNA-binding protein YlxM (UPF0122 family)